MRRRLGVAAAFAASAMLLAGAARSASPSLQVRIGFVTVDASHATEVSAALEQSNARQRLPGLPDTLNPGIIDPAKVTALLKGIEKMPLAAKAPLAGQTLYLNGGEFGIGASAPTTEASFARPFRLTAINAVNGLLTAEASVSPDCTLATARAAEARRQFPLSDAEVEALTTKRESVAGKPDEGDTLRALSAARSRRFAIAQVWQKNAAAVVVCSPGDAKAAKDLADAKHMADSTIVPPSTGMP